jgi:peptide deformylase
VAIQKILRLGHPGLREVCAPVKRSRNDVLVGLVADLRDTLADFRIRNGFGRGIAAPQIGSGQRVVFLDVGREIPLINPRIRRHSRTRMTLWDDCFSFPDLVVKVRRHLRVEVEYQDPAGHPHTLRAEGALAELLQHEIDHLDGILAIDRAVDSRHILYREEWLKLGETKGLPL